MKNCDLPNNWRVVVSREILDIRDGTHHTPKYVTKGIPLITSKNLKNNGIDFQKISLISREDHAEISKRSKVEEGDILFAMIGTIGNPAIVKKDSEFSIKNVGLFKRNLRVVLPSYLQNFLRSSSFERQLNERRLVKGTTQKFIPLANLRDILLPLPPIDEQERIVAKIEEFFSELDAGVESLKKAQAQLKIYRQAVLKSAFEGKLTNQYVSDGELPRDWIWTTLGTACAKIQDGTHFSPKIQYREAQRDRFMYVTAKNIRHNYMDLSNITYIDGEFHRSIYQRCNPEYGDVLLTKDGVNTGEVTLNTLKEPFSLLSSVCLFKTAADRLIPSFLKYYLQSPIGVTNLIGKMSGTAIKRIVLRTIKDAQIVVPPILEQQRIVEEVESRLSVCDKLEETIVVSLKQSEALRQSILKQAFEGRLVSS